MEELHSVIPNGLGRAAEDAAISMMVLDETAKDASEEIIDFSKVFEAGVPRTARPNHKNHAKVRAKNKAAKKARRKNR